MVEAAKETGERSREAQSSEPSDAIGVEENVQLRRAPESCASREKGEHDEAHPAKKPGRPHKRWRIRVVRIDAEKYPEFARDKDHPFAGMAPEARIEEIDAFFARLRARRKNPKPASDGLSAAA